jgi:uncharacterized RDD family membrane protein YckC
MPQIKVTTSFNIDVEFEIPDFGRRMAAWAIDFVLEIGYLFIAFNLFGSAMVDAFESTDGYWTGIAIFYSMLMPLVFYPLLTEILWNGQSVGKKLLHMKVFTVEGSKPSFGQFGTRWLLRIGDVYFIAFVFAILVFSANELKQVFGFFFLFLLGDILCIIISKKNQRLGDLAAGTLLINTNTKGSIEESVFMEVADTYVPAFPEVMRLSDRDMNAIRTILGNATKRNDYMLADRTAYKIKSVLNIDSPLSAFDFLETVMKDYNYLSTR